MLIICDAALLTILYLTQNYIWFWLFLIITIIVALDELWGLLIGFKDSDGVHRKMTLSTAYKRYLERTGWIGYLPIIFFWIGMTALMVHLFFW